MIVLLLIILSSTFKFDAFAYNFYVPTPSPETLITPVTHTTVHSDGSNNDHHRQALLLSSSWSSITSPIYKSILLLSTMEDGILNNPSQSSSLPPLESRSQSQQLNDAMVLKTMRGTQWRFLEERTADSTGKEFSTKEKCRTLTTFRGFEMEDNKGVVNVDIQCSDGSSKDGSAAFTAFVPKEASTTTTTGRWVSKPSSIRKGTIQLSARWKIRLPDDKRVLIYKGNIEAAKIMGKNGSPYDAEMVGVILTGEKVGEEKVVGRFRGDFLRMLDADEAKFITNDNDSGSSGSITLMPKE